MKVENRKIRHKNRTGSGECLRGKKIAKQKWLKKKKKRTENSGFFHFFVRLSMPCPGSPAFPNKLCS